MKRITRVLRGLKDNPGTAVPPLKHSGPRLARRADVEIYFLELFRAQLGAALGAEAELEMVVADERQWQYRLRLFHNGQWRERRMTIGTLGARGGSKSQCFYVIFDTHLVVKIPPRPIVDLPDYLGRLENEARIVDRLQERPCVVPNLTAILSRVKRFAEVPEAAGKRLEACYRQWLEADLSRQRYLKIGGAFAFFMDLSRHRFLGEVLRESIWGAGRLAEVVDEDPALLDDCAAFEQKYGTEAGSLCFALRYLYNAFDVRVRRALVEAAPGGAVTEIEKKAWLLKQAADVPAGKASRIQPPVADILSLLSDDVMAIWRPTVKAYRKLACAEAQRRTLQKNKGRMAALAANLLDLLVWLEQHQVAMRDLKPENLLVAGDASRYPHYLSDPERFAIGLIDLETAVILPFDAEARCPQPQLGGTPAYGTPSHFVSNAILAEVYDGVEWILHLQDWYAAIGILFEIIAGSRLFDRSGRFLNQWIREIHGHGARPVAVRDDYESFNSRFWSVAQREFRIRTAAAEPWLKAVSVAVPEPLRGRLRLHLARHGQSLRRQIDAVVAAGDFIGDKRQRQILARGAVDSVQRLTACCQSPPANPRLSALLKKLVPLKRAQSQRMAAERALGDPDTRIPLKVLLTMMFEVVAQAMRTASPGTPAPALSAIPDDPSPATEAALVECTHSLC